MSIMIDSEKDIISFYSGFLMFYVSFIKVLNNFKKCVHETLRCTERNRFLKCSSEIEKLLNGSAYKAGGLNKQ